ncbi:hypothetical protein DMA11_20430 [Marinilabiliaceae bacterium JC017]|nr:hypothetical protein DMA11_20430 [Marinilabiliaceae bacterium JC017]
MNKIIYIIGLLFFAASTWQVAAEDVTIVSGPFKSRNRTAELKTFEVCKGDVIEIKLTVNHKKRGMDIWMKQQPGDVMVLDYEELRNSSKKIVAPADAIYQIYYGGARLDFNIDIINHTNKPNGPGRGKMVYVCIPDTFYASGYVDKTIGENYTLNPYKEKVVLGSIIQSETVCNRDFFTGEDIIKLSVPGDIKDEYREQKLLSYSVNLVCQSPGVYKEMIGVVKSGVDAFVKMPDIGGNKNGKVDKMDYKHQYEYTDNLKAESDKWENTTELLSIGQETADSLAPNSTGAQALETAAFILDTDGMKKMALNKGLEAAGAPKEMMALINKVDEIPSATDLLKDGIDKYAPKVKGKAYLNVMDMCEVDRDYYEFPQKEFWIQSAMNYGQNNGGCWDVPGHPQAAEKGQKIKCWDIDDGADRRFKIVPSEKYKGYYEIQTALPGDKTYVLDNKGGRVNMQKNGNDLQLWERHGGTCQLFRFEHAGGGKFRIFNYDGSVVCLDGRSNKNGTQIQIWDDHAGNFTEWYLVDPTAHTAFVPAQKKGSSLVRRNVRTISKVGGVINETVKVSEKDDPLYSNRPYVDLSIKVDKADLEAKAKLMVEATYRITDFTDVIKYKRETEEVITKDFWTAYKVRYNYAIMFKDQMRDYYKEISKAQYNSPARPTQEKVIEGDQEQADRLMRYKVLTTEANKDDSASL